MTSRSRWCVSSSSPRAATDTTRNQGGGRAPARCHRATQIRSDLNSSGPALDDCPGLILAWEDEWWTTTAIREIHTWAPANAWPLETHRFT